MLNMNVSMLYRERSVGENMYICLTVCLCVCVFDVTFDM